MVLPAKSPAYFLVLFLLLIRRNLSAEAQTNHIQTLKQEQNNSLQPCQPTTLTFILDQKSGETCLSYGNSNNNSGDQSDTNSGSSKSRRKSRSKSKSSSSADRKSKRERRSLKLKAVSKKIDEVTKMTNRYVDEVNRLILKNEDIDERVKQLYFQLLHEIVEKRDVDLDLSKLQNDLLNKTNTLLVLERDFHKLKAEHERVLRIYVQQASSIDNLSNKFKELERTTEYLKTKCLDPNEQIPYHFNKNKVKIASPITSNSNSNKKGSSSRRRKVKQKAQISTPLADQGQSVVFTPEPVSKIPDLHLVKDMSSTSINSCKSAYERGITMSALLKHTAIADTVVCDTRLGSGWLVINQRIDDATDFNRNWETYKKGFGDMHGGNFWLGNENIHKITKDKKFRLRIELYDWDNNYVYAEYQRFSLSDESDGYRIKVAGYSGTAGDSMVDHNNMRFTTQDRDNDPMITNCADFQKGGWWYHRCADANLNGRFYKSSNGYTDDQDGVFWATFRGITYSLKQVQMMIQEV